MHPTLEQVAETTEPNLLRQWFMDFKRHSTIIAAIAMNPNTPPDVLETIMHKHPYIVARNPNTPASALSQLARVGNLGVAWGVGWNPSTDVADLLWLLEHRVQVTLVVCGNPNLPYGMWAVDAGIILFRTMP